MSNLDRLRRDLGSRYSPDTVRSKIGQAQAFVTFAGEKPQYERAEILTYIDALMVKGMKPGSIRVAIHGIKALLEAMGQPWPFPAGKTIHLPAEAEREQGPTLTIPEVATLIAGVREIGGIPAAAVALSSTYGFRTVELASLITMGLDGHNLELVTAKAKRRRRHTIPPELRDVLTFKKHPLGREALQKLFERLMLQLVRPQRTGEGWHSIRRSLSTQLTLAAVPDYVLKRFMGWTSSDIAFRYFRGDPEEVDKIVYQAHPFLRYWRAGHQPPLVEQ